MSAVSIHALLAECDRILLDATARSISFNPRTPCGVRRNLQRLQKSTIWFQSTHSLRSATVGLVFSLPGEPVSIHALLAECDVLPDMPRRTTTRFNPRTPCGVRPINLNWTDTDMMFQSTHSLRSATVKAHPPKHQPGCFNPRTPCGVRLRPTLYMATQQSKSYFAPTSLKRPSLHGCSF